MSLAVVFFMVAGSLGAQTTAARIDGIMHAYEGSVPGASVMVLRDGAPVFRRSYGMADLEHAVAATPATNYRLASMTKQFTAAAILLLAEDGLLAVDDPVRKWLPTLPDAAAPITLRQLLTHTSGLIDYEDLIPEGTTAQVHDIDVLHMLESQNRTYFAPGSNYRYSDSGYSLLALVVGRASGKDFASFLRERIFTPLRMQHTVAFEEGISSVVDRAYGYSATNQRWTRADQSLTSAVLGDGGIYSSIDDLAKWDTALSDNRLLREGSLRLAFTPATQTDDPAVRYGFGWRMTGETVWHSGETVGFRNVIVRYPKRHLTVIVLTNRDDPAPYPAALAIAKIFEPAADATHAANSVVGPDSAARPLPGSATRPLEARVERVLAATPLIDGHNDLPWEIRSRFKGDLAAVDLKSDTSRLPVPPDSAALMTDIPRLRSGRVGGQFWSVWVPVELKGFEAVQTTLEQIDLVQRMCARHPGDLEMAYSAADVRRIHQSHKVACLIGIEGGHQINNSLAVLRQMYAAGARYMTLTHTTNTDWADSATDAPVHHGLTSFGGDVIREMNRLGMLVDLSHVSPDTMRAALGISEAPVIFSHSSARALVDHPRNVPDDVLRTVGEKGGVVMVNFAPGYVSAARNEWDAAEAAERTRFNSPPFVGLYIGQPERAKAALAEWVNAHPRPAATLAQVADHIEHIRLIAGADHVGLGSDFDGIEDAPSGLEGVDKYPALLMELARRGWTDSDLAKLAGANVLRVMVEAEHVAAKLRAARP